MTKDEKIALINTLRDDYDHAFISPEGVRHFTEPFQARVATYVAEDTSAVDPKGLATPDGQPMEGADAVDVARAICRALGAKYNTSLMGRGFALRDACQAAIDRLQAT